MESLVDNENDIGELFYRSHKLSFAAHPLRPQVKQKSQPIGFGIPSYVFPTLTFDLRQSGLMRTGFFEPI